MLIILKSSKIHGSFGFRAIVMLKFHAWLDLGSARPKAAQTASGNLVWDVEVASVSGRDVVVRGKY